MLTGPKKSFYFLYFETVLQEKKNFFDRNYSKDKHLEQNCKTEDVLLILIFDKKLTNKVDMK